MMSQRSVNDSYGLSPIQQMAAASTGAMITSLFVTPLDVVKIRLQAQQKAFMNNKCFLYCNGLMDHLCSCGNGNGNQWIQRSTQFTGTLDAFAKIVRLEGVASLWSGLPPTLVMAVPSTVIYFTTYEQLRAFFGKYIDVKQHVFVVAVLSGSIARMWAASVISPLELIRTKMQSKRLSYRQVGVAVRDLISMRGYSGLWRGYVPSIMRDVPFSSIYWSNYEYMKAKFLVGEPDFWFSFAAGATSGTIAAVLTLPFDVVKTHRQIELGEKEIYSAKGYLRSSWLGKSITHNDPPQQSAKTYEILKRIYTQSGPRALFTGLVPRVVKVAPACAMMISTYEYFKKFFRHYNEKNQRI